jgi:hypothetical protein
MTLNQSIAARFSNRDLSEAGQLAEKCRFSERCGDAREGRRLSIFVDPRPRASGRWLRVLVVFHVFGHRSVDWSGCILAVREEGSGRRPAAFAFLHPGGRTVFERLPFGRYRLSMQPYGRDIWADARYLPTPEQIEKQGWLQPEAVCRALADRVARTTEPKDAGAEAVATLGLFSDRSVEMAKPAVGACLDILCNPSLPPELRSSASHFITPEKAALLSDIDLTPFSSLLSRYPPGLKNVLRPEPLEMTLYKTLGTLLSARPSIGNDEMALLEVLLTRSQPDDASSRPDAVYTRGGLKNRGPVGLPAEATERLLTALARSGGRSVRMALAEILKTRPGGDRFPAELRRFTP